MKILVHLDYVDGALTSLSRELVTTARALAGPSGQVELLTIGPDAASAQGLGGDRILHVAAAGAYNPVDHAAALDHAIAEAAPDVVLTGYATAGVDLGPVVAMRRNMPLVSYCVDVSVSGGAIVATSQIFGGKLRATVTVQTPCIVMMNAGSADEAEAGDADTPVETLVPAPVTLKGGVKFLSATAPDPNAVDITQASRLLCVGRGIGDEDGIETAREAATLMGAELVGSRPIVDAGWLPKERQVGKSGRKVTPQLYLALGVSGAPEHIEGMGKSGLIIAINTDEHAPIFDHAHYGATVDVADFLPALTAALSGKSG